MKNKEELFTVIDGNEAVADVAFRTNEICIIYPITPSSGMGELADQWSSEQRRNVWGTVPAVVEMQSEAGAAGAMHGALQTGALATTFTASQGLLLMIPDMLRIAGELTPTVFHVASRAVAPQGMTIYCEHSDVMTVRTTGFALLASSSVQEAHDFALIAQAASLESRIPFLHFFDGFRTSHEVAKIFRITDEQILAMIDQDLIIANRERRMCSENPSSRGAVYNTDTFFQQREAVEPFYAKAPEILENYMQRFAKLTGRSYKNIEYFGHPAAERVIVIMGSGAETAHETVDYLVEKGEKIGMLQVRLFMPFANKYLARELPKTCHKIAVLDRTKEPGAGGEPLYQKIASSVFELANDSFFAHEKLPKIIGGRYGIASKEFTPAMIKAIFAELEKDKPKNHFTIGINDDVSKTSLVYDPKWDIEKDTVVRAIFHGLGADGTVSANKNSIKIIGEETEFHAQGYFIYDAKKSGSRTVSHLRFGPDKIRSEYLIQAANFIGCHQFAFIHMIDMLAQAKHGAIFLLNSPYSSDKVWDYLPCPVQQAMIDKQIKFYVIDAFKVAGECGMGSRINIIMQTCFFALANVMPKDEAIAKIKQALEKTYRSKGEKVIQQNYHAVDQTLANLFQVTIPSVASSKCGMMAPISGENIPAFVKNVLGEMLANRGDDLPVSCFPADGTYPIETSKFEKRNISMQSPVWQEEACIQCGRCSLVCPQSIIRAKQYDEKDLINAPQSFKHTKLRGKDTGSICYSLLAYPEDCTGCGVCVEACPVKGKAIVLEDKEQRLESERKNVKFFESLPTIPKEEVNAATVAGFQFLQPYTEFCGSCSGCGESAYVKLITQLFGDRMIIANACGCSSVYGGNMPTSPWSRNKRGQGPAWSSSLFEDNAEFGFGFRLTEDKHQQQALELLLVLADKLDKDLVTNLQQAKQTTDAEINAQRQRVDQLKKQLSSISDPRAKDLLSLADHLVKHSIWAIGGDGWAYDIGFGGLDHVIASGRNINLLVMDTEVYSNTGGQASKATPRGSVAKFATDGRNKAKKDLGLMAMSYNDVFVASICLAANPMQALKAIKEAEAYDGPSIIMAYSPCIAHGIDMRYSLRQEELAVKSGYWLLYRFDPTRAKQGLNPLQLDSPAPSIAFKDYAQYENRYKILARQNPEHAEVLAKLAQEDIDKRRKKYEDLAK
jgi:pyruvate-ferredoxin/flavodoxin oxidoreductase